MSKWIANSVFSADGREYVPGESVPDDLPGGALLAEQGFIVPRDGKKAVWTENAPPEETPLPDAEEAGETPLPDAEEAGETPLPNAEEAGETPLPNAEEAEKKPPRGRRAGAEK